MKIAAQYNAKMYFPSRCPMFGATPNGEEAALCEHPELTHPVKCLYMDTNEMHIDPPINCPLRMAPAALIIEGVAI